MSGKPQKREPNTGVNRVSAAHLARGLRLSAAAVRCLGPGKEHSFHNDGTRGNRVCYACRAKLERVPESCVRVCRSPNKNGNG